MKRGKPQENLEINLGNPPNTDATQNKKRTVSHFQAGVDPVPNLD